MSALNHQVGQFYYHAWYDDVDDKVEIWEYGLRSIRKGAAYFTAKLDGVTWGKRSSKTGDFGWLVSAPAWARHRERIGGTGIQRYARSKAQALRAALALERKSRERYKGDPESLADCDVAIAALQKRLKRTKT